MMVDKKYIIMNFKIFLSKFITVIEWGRM